MKNRFFYCFLGLIFCFSCFPLSSCKSNKVSLIQSKTYGSIRPVDIYNVIDGYMYSVETMHEEIHLNKQYDFYATKYSTTKRSTINSLEPLLQKPELKISMLFFDGYYSRYWGEAVKVEFVTNLKFYKTYHLGIKENSDTYKITYYNIGNGKSFNSLNSINDYKKVIEIPKSDIEKIEYFV